jgi:hypothetical protein
MKPLVLYQDGVVLALSPSLEFAGHMQPPVFIAVTAVCVVAAEGCSW